MTSQCPRVVEHREINGIPEVCAVFDFTCEGCGSEGEWAIPLSDLGPHGCPEGCGATYILWKQPDDGWRLTCVVCPIYGN